LSWQTGTRPLTAGSGLSRLRHATDGVGVESKAPVERTGVQVSHPHLQDVLSDGIKPTG